LLIRRYGRVTKFFHWAIFVLILNQFVVAAMMFNTPSGETTAGFSQGALYEWHKSVGLIVLAVALVRFVWRKTTTLPDWAPNLSDGEKRAIHLVERTLYVCMFLMPISGFLFVMTGDFGVLFFNRWELPNIVGVNPTAALITRWTHAATAALLTVALFGHWGIAIRHQRIHRDRYVHRMLPFTHQ
jgi:cytochrome b561